MIPGPVGIIAGFSDIALSLATGDFSSASKAFVNMLVMRGFGGLINNMCKLPKPVKYLVGSALFGFGAYNVTKAYTMIKQSALNLVDLIYNGGSIFDYIHEISTGVQGVGLLSGGVKLSVGSAVGMVRQCFVAGTKVKTEDGDKNIEDIEEGDLVWAYDPVTGETGLKEVKQTFENETETLVHVTVSNENDKETIDTTVRHPFYVVGYGFRFASELRVGDKVLSVSGDIYEVTSVEIEDLDEPVKIYNFEVEDWHTYFVSESGILVHNDGCGTGTPNTTEDTNTDKQDTSSLSTGVGTSASTGGSKSKKQPGSYIITFKSGKKYVGKGPKSRMEQSAKYRSEINNDPVVSKVWEPAATDADAFVAEYLKLKEIGGPQNENNYNAIESPGKKILENRSKKKGKN